MIIAKNSGAFPAPLVIIRHNIIYGDAPLWSPSYFIATTGTTVLEKVKDYIDSQRTDEHHQKYSKYVKSGLYRKNRR